jgi:hypothetical protein
MPLPIVAGALFKATTAGAGLGALGTGLAAGASLAGGVGLFGKLGLSAIGTGLGGAGGVLGGAALTPAVASLAPAAAAQATGTIAPSIIQSTGLEALKGKVIGAGVQNAAAQQATNLAFQNAAAQNMAGGLASKIAPQMAGYNPATAEALSAKFLANSPPLAKPFAGETLIAGEGSPIAFQQTPQAANTFSEAGFKGLQRNAPQLPSLSNPTATPVNPADIVGRSIRPDQNFFQNLGNIGSFQDVKDYAGQHPYATSAMAGLGAMGVAKMMEPKKIPKPEDNAMIRPYTFERTQRPEAYAVSPTQDSSERLYFNDQFNAGEPYKATEKAGGGIAAAYAIGGPVEQMAAMNAVGANTGYPQAGLQTPMYSNPAMQRPQAANVIAPSADAGVNTYTGEARFARGGEANLGDYSDGGRLLKGPGDGVSDSIPAVIGKRQPARLADGEFVIPARIVSELGNGSTEAGARKLYAMMERIQNTRKKSIGKKKVAVNSKADRHLPA